MQGKVQKLAHSLPGICTKTLICEWESKLALECLRVVRYKVVVLNRKSYVHIQMPRIEDRQRKSRPERRSFDVVKQVVVNGQKYKCLPSLSKNP
jgi:hypothetical protein